MDGTLAIKIFAAVFVLLSLGIPAYLFVTKPKIKTGYRSRSRKKQQRILVLSFVSFITLVILLTIFAIFAIDISELLS